ncbi:MAG: biotin--[acetyl-CoA-carboxylase] ligase [Bacteroidetes bacterium]|nr:biotin--[acetyl-CoA-carboxylase] ligase [Bacteroidota bacterium]
MKGTDKKIIFLNEVESTNNYANQLILSNAAEEGTVVLTHYQKKGRGQLGNHWESEAGKNLLASIILYPELLKAGKQFYLSKIVSLSIVEYLKREVADVSVKWPNDIYIGTKKIAGILIENSIKGNYLFTSILGIGLNLNQKMFLSDAPNPVSLTQLTGKEYEIEKVVSDIFKLIQAWYQKIQRGNFAEIDSAYLSMLFRNGEWSQYSKNGISFEAKIIGIGEFGQLQLENREGVISEYVFKEIEFIL